MVALFLTVVLSGLILTTYRVTTQATERWRRSGLLYTHTHLLVERLAADLAGAAHVAPPTPLASDTVWTITGVVGEHHTYRWSAGAAHRDSHRLHPPEVTVDELAIRVHSRRADLRLTTRLGRHRLTIETSVILRHPPPWTPLPLGARPTLRFPSPCCRT